MRDIGREEREANLERAREEQRRMVARARKRREIAQSARVAGPAGWEPFTMEDILDPQDADAYINSMMESFDRAVAPILDALHDLVALYASSPGADPNFVTKGQRAVAAAPALRLVVRETIGKSYTDGFSDGAEADG